MATPSYGKCHIVLLQCRFLLNELSRSLKFSLVSLDNAPTEITLIPNNYAFKMNQNLEPTEYKTVVSNEFVQRIVDRITDEFVLDMNYRIPKRTAKQRNPLSLSRQRSTRHWSTTPRLIRSVLFWPIWQVSRQRQMLPFKFARSTSIQSIEAKQKKHLAELLLLPVLFRNARMFENGSNMTKAVLSFCLNTSVHRKAIKSSDEGVPLNRALQFNVEIIGAWFRFDALNRGSETRQAPSKSTAKPRKHIALLLVWRCSV